MARGSFVQELHGWRVVVTRCSACATLPVHVGSYSLASSQVRFPTGPCSSVLPARSCSIFFSAVVGLAAPVHVLHKWWCVLGAGLWL